MNPWLWGGYLGNNNPMKKNCPVHAPSIHPSIHPWMDTFVGAGSLWPIGPGIPFFETLPQNGRC